jgi:hypothetical protein
MIRLLSTGILMAVVAAGCAGGRNAQAGGPNLSSGAQEGWVVLFDGEGMEGWEARATSNPNTTGDWRVENGFLVCGGTAPSWLHTNAEFSNFRLSLEFQGADSVNSGVFLRSQREGEPHRTGYELNIWDYQPAGYNTGSLNDHIFARPSPGVIPGIWNSLDVTARGDHFLVVLNGATVLDGRDPTHSRGVIGLQCQANNPIEFRNIRILPL